MGASCVKCTVWCVQGCDPAGPLHEQTVRDTDWGFATRLPDLKQLLQDFASQSNNAAAANASTSTGPRIPRL